MDLIAYRCSWTLWVIHIINDKANKDLQNAENDDSKTKDNMCLTSGGCLLEMRLVVEVDGLVSKSESNHGEDCGSKQEEEDVKAEPVGSDTLKRKGEEEEIFDHMMIG